MHLMDIAPPPLGQAPVFALRHLAYTYADGTQALQDLSLDIVPGDRIALVGQSGSGKSTLLRLLSGLLPVEQGRLDFDGRPLTPEGLPALRRRAGVLFQDPDDHLFCNSLNDDVAFGPRNLGLDAAAVDRIVGDRLAAVSLTELRYKPAHNLSYGQKKRAALAAVLATEPDILLLDEPAANLDPHQEQLLHQLLAAYTGTLVVIEHDLLFLADLCQRAVVLDQGRMHHDCLLTDLLAQPETLREHGLDYTFRCPGCPQEPVVPHGHRHHQATHVHGPGRPHLEPPVTVLPLVELQHYSYCYPDGSLGLQDINLGLFTGETVALVGENGAGKSTLAHCLLGLNNGEGTCLFAGQRLAPGDYRRLWQRVGMVFQHSADQLFCPSCWEEVAFGPQQLGLPAAQVEQRVEKALALVRLTGFEQRVPLHLSGGERKRLAIAAALSLQPDLLILDEPSASLDAPSQALLLTVLAALPMAQLLITHDPLFIGKLSQRTVVLHQGRIVRDYPTIDFLADQDLQTINGLNYSAKHLNLRRLWPEAL